MHGNKGKKLSEEHKRKIGEANKISRLGLKLSEATKHKIGIATKKSWEKGVYKSGMKHTDATKKKISEATRLERHPLWKGDKAGYGAKHNRIYRLKGKAKKCSVCGAEDRHIQWSNKDHKYSGDVSDYIQMCVPCHRKYDLEKFGKGRMGSNQYAIK